MLELSTGPVTVKGYRTPNNADGQPMKYGDQTPVEMCEFAVEGEEKPREIKLLKGMNGNRPPAGQLVHLQLSSIVEPQAKLGKNGDPYIANVTKYTVVGHRPVAK